MGTYYVPCTVRCWGCEGVWKHGFCPWRTKGLVKGKLGKKNNTKLISSPLSGGLKEDLVNVNFSGGDGVQSSMEFLWGSGFLAGGLKDIKVQRTGRVGPVPGEGDRHPVKKKNFFVFLLDSTYKYYHVCHIYHIYDTEELISKTHRHGKQTCGYQRGKRGWDKFRSLRLTYTHYNVQNR